MNVELNLEQDTVMPNAHMILNGSTEKQTATNGTHQIMMKMLEPDILDHAVQRWIFGKLTALLKPTQPIHAPQIMPTDAKELNVVTMLLMKGIFLYKYFYKYIFTSSS